MPASDLLDRIAAPVGFLFTFGALLVLLCAAYSSDLDRALSRMPGAPGGHPLPDPVRTALRCFQISVPGRPDLKVRMAGIVADKALGERQGPGEAIRLRAYRDLLLGERRGSRLTDRFLAVADFGELERVPVHGIREASRRTFGLSADSLSLGESLILLHRALDGRGQAFLTDRSGLIGVRNRLLLRALGMGVIDTARYAEEARQPLSLVSDRRPVW